MDEAGVREAFRRLGAVYGSISPTNNPTVDPARKIKARLFYLTEDGRSLSSIDQDVPFADTPTEVTGIGFIRRKETDRIGNTVRELQKEFADALTLGMRRNSIRPPAHSPRLTVMPMSAFGSPSLLQAPGSVWYEPPSSHIGQVTRTG